MTQFESMVLGLYHCFQALPRTTLRAAEFLFAAAPQQSFYKRYRLDSAEYAPVTRGKQ
jgi:hypothetical protein